MIRLCLAALAISTMMLVAAAEARGRRGSCCCHAAPAATDAADHAAQTPAPPVQAQRPEASRSYSYDPGSYVAPIGGNYGLEGYYNPPRESWGLRPASAKANGNY